VYRIAAIPLARRLLILVTALLLCALLFHGTVAVALISRGDAFLQRGKPDSSLAYYSRALLFDGGSALAADRYAFASMLSRRSSDIDQGIAVATRALNTDDSSVALLTDRALLFQLKRDYRDAALDFARAAQTTADPRLFHFAGWAAFRAGDRQRAISLWRQALRSDRGFTPARIALSRAGAAQ
jgi:tetratricopeptide (TPR) repeat protein